MKMLVRFIRKKDTIIGIDAHVFRCVLYTNTCEFEAATEEYWWPQTDTCLIYDLLLFIFDRVFSNSIYRTEFIMRFC